MKIPQSIDKNILDVYLESPDNDHAVQPCCLDLSWNSCGGHVPRLSHLCIISIAENWINNPVTSLGLEEDTSKLLQELSLSTVPLPLLVARLPHEAYWQEAYRRTYHVPVPSHTPALTAYLEKYTADYLEKLHPKDYDPQQISELVSMCGEVLRRLEVKQLTAGGALPSAATAATAATRNSSRTRTFHYRDMIPLGSVLSGLTNLTELSLSLGLCSPEGGYSRDLRRLSSSQLRKIVQGIAHCSQLQMLSITRSDIDCEKINILLEGLNGLQQLRVLNLGHCAVGDRGALELSSFLLQKPSCRELILVNNKIGAHGAEGLAYALCQPTCRLLSLDLSCNTTLGVKGVKLILTALLRGTLLNKLNISACGVCAEKEGVEVAGVLAAALAAGRTPLRELDISNNLLGQDSGGALLAALETRGSSGPTVLRARSCSLGRWEAALQRATFRTAARRRAAQLRFKGGARRLLQAKRIARAIGIDDEIDPLQLARQLTARPSAASLPLSLTLSLSFSQDLLLQDLPSSAREVLHIEIPNIKNPMCPSPTIVKKQRRSTFPTSNDQKRDQQRRSSEYSNTTIQPPVEPQTTNICIHFKAMH